MDKTIAELDGTLVLNYIDDDIEIMEPLVLEEDPPEPAFSFGEPMEPENLELDTSFDENQNPKLESKAVTPERTPKRNKDLIILLENRVLSPAVNEDIKLDFEEIKVDISEDSNSLEHINPEEIKENTVRTKRARSPEVTKKLPTPIAKKVKSGDTVVNDLNIKTLNNSLETNGLEPIKRKRGRPKSLGVKTPNVSKIPVSKTSLRKDTKKNRLSVKQNANITETNHLEPIKAKREKSRKLGAKNTIVSSSPKAAAEVTKPKRGRPKSLKAAIVDVSLVSNATSVKSKDLDALKETTSQLQPAKSKNNVDTKQHEAEVETPKRKRGRPKGFKLKKDPISEVDKALDNSKVKQTETTDKATTQLDPSSKSSNIDLSDCKVNEAGSLEANETFSFVISNFETSEDAKIDIKSVYLLPSRGKKGRPKSLEAKQANLNFEKSEGENLNTKTDVRSQYLPPPKSKTRRPKSLEAKNVAFPETSKNSSSTSITNLIKESNLNLNNAKSSKLTATTDGDLKARTLDVTANNKNEKLPKTKIGKTKNSVAKGKPAIIPIGSQLSKSKESEIGNVKEKPVAVSAEPNDIEVPLSKAVTAKNLTAKMVNPSKAKPIKKKSLKDKQKNNTLETIDLTIKSLKAAKNKVNLTENKIVRSRENSKVRSKESIETCLQEKKHNRIVEIIDLRPSKPKKDRPRSLGSVGVNHCVTTTEPQPSTSNENIDVELSTPSKPRGYSLGATSATGIKKTKTFKQLTIEETQIGNMMRKLNNSSEANKEFKFAKPKNVQPNPFVVKKVIPFVGINDTKPSTPEGAEIKKKEYKHIDASVGTKGVEPPLIKDVEVQRKPSLCTVGTQTIELDDDEPEIPEVKGAARKMSVGTQALSSPKIKAVEVKGLGRKTSGTAKQNVDLDARVEKNATDSEKVSTPAPKGGKATEKRDRSEQNITTIKTETCNTNSDVTMTSNQIEEWSPGPNFTANATLECPEIGIKYETLEQIHTEFKYESQSEAEIMIKRRKMLGGSMRGKKRGFNKMMGPTTIDNFLSIVDVNGKVQMKFKNQIFKCDHCLYVGNSKANLERHSLIHRNPDEIIWFHCTECSYKSKYEHQLKSHFLIHLKPDQIKFFQCPHCDVKCSRKHNLNNHIKSIHAIREYSFRCAECDYSTFSKDRLVAHIKKHSKEVHACTLCKFVTKRREYLDSHFKMKHTEQIPRPFPCDTCSYKGKTKRELDKHYDRMHNKEQLHVYQCNHCSFNSIYKKNLEFHLLHMHNNSEGFQKFICGHCQKTFSYKNGLKVHIIRCHIKLPEEFWHKCLECKYRSKDVSTLKRHIKRNHGAPRFHCTQCSFATNRQTSMEAHVKTHEFDNEDILKCPECPYRIIQMSSFLYHMKVIHGKPITSKDAEQYYLQDD